MNKFIRAHHSNSHVYAYDNIGNREIAQEALIIYSATSQVIATDPLGMNGGDVMCKSGSD